MNTLIIGTRAITISCGGMKSKSTAKKKKVLMNIRPSVILGAVLAGTNAYLRAHEAEKDAAQVARLHNSDPSEGSLLLCLPEAVLLLLVNSVHDSR